MAAAAEGSVGMETDAELTFEYGVEAVLLPLLVPVAVLHVGNGIGNDNVGKDEVGDSLKDNIFGEF